MAKYSEEFKFMVVQDYLNSPLSYRVIARKYRIAAKSQVRHWGHVFKNWDEVATAIQFNYE